MGCCSCIGTSDCVIGDDKLSSFSARNGLIVPYLATERKSLMEKRVKECVPAGEADLTLACVAASLWLQQALLLSLGRKLWVEKR
ncbi:hypothetical protein KTAU_00530 [Thermogemmatispora aurantia]|uniref:Uncharacterized protein n=1 Tax=Thermogemmatispora aurantia TaxID=2045279 RepID=A0A5J4JUG2_9CHLR|nr:hypothetical protein KTAU_00530 [Thermogemmatispora aurantia]